MDSTVFQLMHDVELTHWWFVARRRILRSLIEQVLPPSKETLVVDIGCGTGANIASLGEAYCCVGIDVSTEAIELARQRFPAVRFVAGHAPEDLAEAMPRASLLLMTDVLEHVAEDCETFARLVAATRPGAYFLLTVPADMALWSEHDVSHGHYRRYDVARFRQVWEGLPVREVLLSYFNSRLYPVVRLVRSWNRLWRRAAGEANTDLATSGPLTNRILERIFAGERHRLLRLLRGERARQYRCGVSLLALLERQEG